MIADQRTVYQDILDQPVAYERVLRWQQAAGWRNLELAAEALAFATEIVVVAIGASFSASLPFVQRLARHGLRISLEDAAEFLHFNHSGHDDQAVYLLISRSGETIEITRALDLLGEKDCFTIGITNVATSALAARADMPILLGSPDDTIIAVQTYLATLLTLYLLGELVVTETEPVEVLENAAGLLADVAETVGTYQLASQVWAADFQPYQAIYLLARGYSLASAHQGALLLHEMARFPGVATYSAGHFRHGPWEVVDERIRLIVFAPADQTYALNMALAHDLRRFGGDTTVVAPRPAHDSAAGLTHWSIPSTTPQLAPILEIIPVLFFVHEYAEWRGLTPGLFRASTPITLTEGGTTHGDA